MTDAPDRRAGFVARHRDELILQAIGSLVLGMIVSLALYAVEQMQEDARNARDESLGNSLFVRQAVMSERDTLPFSSLYLEDAQLSGLSLAGADLSDAVLASAELKDADLTDADLSETDLTRADLSGADLTGADLSESDLSGADVSGAVLTDADLEAAVLDGTFHDAGDPPVADAAVLARLAVGGNVDDDD